MTEAIFYDPREPGRPLPHDPIKAIVAPRPIGWISTVSKDGTPNLAPYSFFNGFSADPWIIGFSSERRSDSLINCEETGEFVHNLVPEALAAQMNATSAPFARGVDEFGEAGLEAAACRNVRAPRVAASPASLECRVIQIVPMHGLDGRRGRATLVLGQVIGVHIDPAHIENGIFQPTRAVPLARLGHNDYARIAETFEMRRPTLKD